MANLRREAARLIREARRRAAGQARDLRDCWEERMARYIIDGGLSEQETEQVALAEIADAEPPADRETMTPAERARWICDTAAGSRWHERQSEQLSI